MSRVITIDQHHVDKEKMVKIYNKWSLEYDADQAYEYKVEELIHTWRVMLCYYFKDTLYSIALRDPKKIYDNDLDDILLNPYLTQKNRYIRYFIQQAIDEYKICTFKKYNYEQWKKRLNKVLFNIDNCYNIDDCTVRHYEDKESLILRKIPYIDYKIPEHELEWYSWEDKKLMKKFKCKIINISNHRHHKGDLMYFNCEDCKIRNTPIDITIIMFDKPLLYTRNGGSMYFRYFNYKINGGNLWIKIGKCTKIQHLTSKYRYVFGLIGVNKKQIKCDEYHHYQSMYDIYDAANKYGSEVEGACNIKQLVIDSIKLIKNDSEDEKINTRFNPVSMGINTPNNISNSYVYILMEREFIKTSEKIYKIGKTRQEPNKRMAAYPKNSKLYIMIHVDNCDIMENKIKMRFDIDFHKRSDIGNEYYEGDIKLMLKTFLMIVNS